MKKTAVLLFGLWIAIAMALRQNPFFMATQEKE